MDLVVIERPASSAASNSAFRITSARGTWRANCHRRDSRTDDCQPSAPVRLAVLQCSGGPPSTLVPGVLVRRLGLCRRLVDRETA